MERKRLAMLLRALSDDTRLTVFDAVVSGVRCTSQVAEKLDLPVALASHHLRILEDAGLLNRERVAGDARWICYSVDQGELLRFDAAMRELLDARRIDTRPPKCKLL